MKQLHDDVDGTWVETELICCQCFYPRTFRIPEAQKNQPWVCMACEQDLEDRNGRP